MRISRIVPVLVTVLLLLSCHKGEEGSQVVATAITPYYLLNEGDETPGSSSVLTFVGGSYVRLGQTETQMDMPVYPRFIKTKDGRYLMFYHAGTVDSWAGTYCAYAESEDLLSWKYVKQVFPIQRNVQGHYENVITRYYAGVHPLRLPDGRMMAVASYRGSQDMRHNLLDNGLAIKFSSDEGRSWTQEIRINVGTNWEPRPLVLPSGRVVVYYTDSCPYVEGIWASAIISTGVSYIYSDDCGKTWKPDDPLNNHLFAFRQLRDSKNGQNVYTDQMPGVICLPSGRLVGTGESNLAPCSSTTTDYYVSLSYGEADGSWGMPDERGEMPRERINDFCKGAAPTLEQFSSGEVILTYNNKNTFFMRMGNSEAKNFSEERRLLDSGSLAGKGFWGSVLPDGHVMVAGIGGSGGQSGLGYSLQVGQYYLNHDVVAATHSVTVDGNNVEWPRSGQALFVGSRDEMHATLRSSVSGDRIFFMAEVEKPTWTSATASEGYVTVYLCSPEENKLSEGDVSLSLRFDGSMTTSVYHSGWYRETLPVEMRAVNGEGFSLVEWSLPLSSVPVRERRIRVNFGLGDATSHQLVNDASAPWQHILIQ